MLHGPQKAALHICSAARAVGDLAQELRSATRAKSEGDKDQ